MDHISFDEWIDLGLSNRMRYSSWLRLKTLFPNITPDDVPTLEYDPLKVVHRTAGRIFWADTADCGFDAKAHKWANCNGRMGVDFDIERDITCPSCLFLTYMRWASGYERKDGSWRVGFLLDPDTPRTRNYYECLAQVARFFNQQHQASIAWDCVENLAAPLLLATPLHHTSQAHEAPDAASTSDALCLP